MAMIAEQLVGGSTARSKARAGVAGTMSRPRRSGSFLTNICPRDSPTQYLPKIRLAGAGKQNR